MVGPGKVATSLAADPPRLYPQMVCAGMFVSEVILKFEFARMRSRLRAATYIAAAKAAPAEAARGGLGVGQSSLSEENPRARHETHLHQVAPRESRLDQLQPVFQGILHCLPLRPRDSFSF